MITHLCKYFMARNRNKIFPEHKHWKTDKHYASCAATFKVSTWWWNGIEMFSALLEFCEENPPVTGGCLRPSQRSFDVFFVVCVSKLLKKQCSCQWFVMPGPSYLVPVFFCVWYCSLALVTFSDVLQGYLVNIWEITKSTQFQCSYPHWYCFDSITEYQIDTNILAHTMTARMSCHVHNFVMITLSDFGRELSKIFIKFRVPIYLLLKLYKVNVKLIEAEWRIHALVI